MRTRYYNTAVPQFAAKRGFLVAVGVVFLLFFISEKNENRKITRFKYCNLRCAALSLRGKLTIFRVGGRGGRSGFSFTHTVTRFFRLFFPCPPLPPPCLLLFVRRLFFSRRKSCILTLRCRLLPAVARLGWGGGGANDPVAQFEGRKKQFFFYEKKPRLCVL